MKSTTNIAANGLIKLVFIRFVILFIVMCAAFFGPARTFAFWEAWVYLCIVFTCATAVIIYFLKNDRDLLVRRMMTKENLKEQRLIIRFGWLLYIPTFIIPGFDKYYRWSNIPTYIIVSSDIIVLLAYLLIFRVFRENSYASRVVETYTSQKVITTGLYALIRHPMYTGMILMFGFTPLALGSYWASIGTIFFIVIIIARLYSEEKFLSESLPGYQDYMKKTQYRLIPWIW